MLEIAVNFLSKPNLLVSKQKQLEIELLTDEEVEVARSKLQVKMLVIVFVKRVKVRKLSQGNVHVTLLGRCGTKIENEPSRLRTRYESSRTFNCETVRPRRPRRLIQKQKVEKRRQTGGGRGRVYSRW